MHVGFVHQYSKNRGAGEKLTSVEGMSCASSRVLYDPTPLRLNEINALLHVLGVCIACRNI